MPSTPDSAHAAIGGNANAIRCSVQGGVATVTLNRPSRMNAMNVHLLLALKAALLAVLADTSVRVVVLAGSNGNFSTGADLKDQSTGPNGELRLDVLHDCFRSLIDARKPFIAAVEGNAYGAGLSIALACDYIIAGGTARFCAPFTGIGLIPDTGLGLTLPLRIGMGRARRMMYEGLVLDSNQALEWGLVEHAVPTGEALKFAHDTAHTLLDRAPLALGALRELLSRQWPDPETFLREEYRLQRMLQQTDDVLEGRRAFAERRSPRFTGS